MQILWLQCESKKKYTGFLIITLANVDQFTKFFHYEIPEEILYIKIMKILHLTLNMFLHYLVKVENWNCCWFQWHIACKWCQQTEAINDWRVTWAAADSHWWSSHQHSLTIFQVGALQKVLVSNTTVTFWQWWSRLLHKLHEVCRHIIFPKFLHFLLSVLHVLHKN